MTGEEALLRALGNGDELALSALADLAEETGDLPRARAWRLVKDKGWRPAPAQAVKRPHRPSWDWWRANIRYAPVYGLPTAIFDALQEEEGQEPLGNYREYSSPGRAYRALVDGLVAPA